MLTADERRLGCIWIESDGVRLTRRRGCLVGRRVDLSVAVDEVQTRDPDVRQCVAFRTTGHQTHCAETVSVRDCEKRQLAGEGQYARI